MVHQIPQYFIALHMSAFSASIIGYMPVCISQATVSMQSSFATYNLYLLFIGCTSKTFYPITTVLLKSTIRIYWIKKFLLLHVMINIFYGFYVFIFWLFIGDLRYCEQNEIIHLTFKMNNWCQVFSHGKYNGYFVRWFTAL